MNVAELIYELEKYPQDLPVYIHDDEYGDGELVSGAVYQDNANFETWDTEAQRYIEHQVPALILG